MKKNENLMGQYNEVQSTRFKIIVDLVMDSCDRYKYPKAFYEYL